MHDDDGEEEGVAQAGGHTPPNRLTETHTLGSLFLDIYVMVN